MIKKRLLCPVREILLIRTSAYYQMTIQWFHCLYHMVLYLHNGMILVKLLKQSTDYFLYHELHDYVFVYDVDLAIRKIDILFMDLTQI